jgi:hypothetical protein
VDCPLDIAPCRLSDCRYFDRDGDDFAGQTCLWWAQHIPPRKKAQTKKRPPRAGGHLSGTQPVIAGRGSGGRFVSRLPPSDSRAG